MSETPERFNRIPNPDLIESPKTVGDLTYLSLSQILLGIQVNNDTSEVPTDTLLDNILAKISPTDFLNLSTPDNVKGLREVIKKNKDVADYSGIQEEFLNSYFFVKIASDLGIEPTELNRKIIEENGLRNISRLFRLINRLTDGSSLKSILYEEIYRVQRAMELGVPPEDLSDSKQTAIKGFDGIQPLMVQTIAEMIKDTDARRELLGVIDNIAKSSSEINVAELFDAEKYGKIVRKDLVIVGGGPLTAIASAILSPYFDITVITEQDRIGEPWRSRPLYINSSVVVKDENDVQLPLLGGATTPVSPYGFGGQVSINTLLDNTALVVPCPDGTTREYISGQRLGAATATVIGCNVSDFLVGHRVLFDLVVKNIRDNTTTIYIQDLKTAEIRRIRANQTLFLCGPGNETCKFEDELTKADYKYSRELVETQIKKTKELVEQGRIDDVKFELPRILTFTDIEKLTGLWQNDLQRRQDLFPMSALFAPGLDIGIVGSKDTARILREYLDANAPPESYPQDFDFDQNLPRVTIYNESAKTPEEYAKKVRKRYQGTFSKKNMDRTNTNPAKVNAVRYKSSKLDAVTVEVQIPGRSGSLTVHDYVILATGFERPDISDFLTNLALRRLFDTAGNAVGLSNNIGDYIGGSFDGLSIDNGPAGLKNIVRALGIPENTISLWVTACKLQRLIYTLLANEPLNQAKITDLAENTILNSNYKYPII